MKTEVRGNIHADGLKKFAEFMLIKFKEERMRENERGPGKDKKRVQSMQNAV